MANKLDKKDLSKVSGGVLEDKNNQYGPFHTNCGGKVLNVGNPFRSCRCSKCDEKHYWSSDFSTYFISKTGPNTYVKVNADGSLETLNSRPWELDQ